jgi:hypothetical protein
MAYRFSAGQQSSPLLEKRLLINVFSKTAILLIPNQITPNHVLHNEFLYVTFTLYLLLYPYFPLDDQTARFFKTFCWFT